MGYLKQHIQRVKTLCCARAYLPQESRLEVYDVTCGEWLKALNLESEESRFKLH